MKKILTITATVLVALLPLIIVLKTTFAQRNVFGAGTQDELEIAKQISLGYLQAEAQSRNIGNPSDFKIERVEIDDLSMAHTRVRQTVDNIPVWEGEAIVHLKSDGSLSTITDDLKTNISVNTQPNFSEKDAYNLAIGMFEGKAELTGEAKIELFIFRGEDRDHLTYRVETQRIDGMNEPTMPVVFIDAQTGERVYGYDNLQTATGSGLSLYSGTVSIQTYQNGSTFYLEDIGRKVGTFDLRNTTSSVYRFTDTDNTWNTTTQRAAVDAHYGAVKTLDYYQNVHGRNGIDGSGGPAYYTSADGVTGLISSVVHYSTNYNNAFWNGSYMTYGDGDGTTFTPLTTLDICGHEMTHGVTERTANLTYAKESGALNESWSDMMGSMVELYADGGSPTANTWKIGEDAYTPSNGTGDALRYMDDPTISGDPDHYSERLYPGTCTPSNTNDQCGVHTNSSIANKAFYLAVAGGTHPQTGVTVSGVGATNGAKIFYRALTTYMTSGTNFAGARTATLSAATDLFGGSSSQYSSIANAWCAVGVGSCASSTPTPTPTATPPGGGSELLINGGFEGSASPWTASGSGVFYTASGSYPHGGTGYEYFGVNNSTAGQAYQQVAIPSNATGTLSFWLNVTSSETTTSTQYDKLFVEVRNSSGTLLTTLATYSNLNKGTAGSYSQKSFSVAAYKGQTVRIQFRTTTDSSVTTTFRVDDVSLK